MMKVVSLFAGAGGMDLGFKQAGFDVPWANEYDKTIWDTYRFNHPGCKLNTKSIRDIKEDEIPDCDGVIGGPPCQSWSLAGTMRGINDSRGELFFEYLRILKAKKPLFCVAENVPGILSKTHKQAFDQIKTLFKNIGYNIREGIVNAADYEVPQDRKRVIIVGYRNDLNMSFSMPPKLPRISLLEALSGLPAKSVPALAHNKANPEGSLEFPNHEHMLGKYSFNYMSRNRVRDWKQQSFTIIASGRHTPQYPGNPPMQKVSKDVFEFVPGHDYRRLSIRECARIQTFPDDFKFLYNRLEDGYKMVGNAVPVTLARHIALQIKDDIQKYKEKDYAKEKPHSAE